ELPSVLMRCSGKHLQLIAAHSSGHAFESRRYNAPPTAIRNFVRLRAQGMSEGEPQHEVTRLIQAASASDRAAADQLLTLVYDQLRKIAQQRMNAERSDHTLQATALVHEVYVRLLGHTEVLWQNRAHFLAVAAEAM